MASYIQRRKFLATLLGGAAAWPLAARAQQPAKLPTIGFLGGTSPSVVSQSVAAFVQRLHELGWVEGRNVAIEYRWAEGRSERFAEIAATVAPAAHAILLVDQAGWHLSTRLLVPANITIILLPPKCPELNPVENVWQFMRDNWLSNRIFKSYDDLVDHCCAAWNKLVDQPWRIMSIGLRQWAHGF